MENFKTTLDAFESKLQGVDAAIASAGADLLPDVRRDRAAEMRRDAVKAAESELRLIIGRITAAIQAKAGEVRAIEFPLLSGRFEAEKLRGTLEVNNALIVYFKAFPAEAMLRDAFSAQRYDFLFSLISRGMDHQPADDSEMQEYRRFVAVVDEMRESLGTLEMIGQLSELRKQQARATAVFAQIGVRLAGAENIQDFDAALRSAGLL